MIGRPPKEGIDYSGWDVSILDNDEKIDKLIDAQGIGAFTIYFYLCQKAYATKGYYLIWSYSLCATIARKLGRGASAEYVKNVVDVCFQSGLFDKRLFELHGILTSRGIQKRYWAVAKDRRAVAIISEYWLLDEEESPSFYNRAQKSNYDPSKLNYDPSKSHKSKGNESKEKEKRERTFVPPAEEEVTAFCHENGYAVDAGRFVDYYNSIGWMVGNRRMTDWQASIRNWARRDAEAAKKAAAEAEKKKAEIGFDLDEFFEAATRKRPKEEYGKKEET